MPDISKPEMPAEKATCVFKLITMLQSSEQQSVTISIIWRNTISGRRWNSRYNNKIRIQEPFLEAFLKASVSIWHCRHCLRDRRTKEAGKMVIYSSILELVSLTCLIYMKHVTFNIVISLWLELKCVNYHDIQFPNFRDCPKLFTF